MSRPVKTAACNFVYLGPEPEIGDLWVQREPAERAVYAYFEPTEEEYRLLRAGGRIRLGIYGTEPIPPVSVDVLPEVATHPVGEHPWKESAGGPRDPSPPGDAPLLCRHCDVYVGYAAAGTVHPPIDALDREWLRKHCWVCWRSAEEIREAQA